MKRLEQWSLIHVYTALGRTVTRAKGEIYGHDELADGTEVTTGEVVEILHKSRQIVFEDRTFYQLGDPHPAYLAAMRGHSAETDRLLGLVPQKPEATP